MGGIKPGSETLTTGAASRLGEGASVRGEQAFVRIITDATELTSVRPEWEQLAADCAEQNVFLEAMCVFPALDLPEASDAIHVFVFHPCGEEEPRLIGYLALTCRNVWGRLSPKRAKSWSHRTHYLGEPLIARGAESLFWVAVMAALDAGRLGSSSLQLSLLKADSASTRTLVELLQAEQRPVHTVRSLRRAFISSQSSYEAYAQEAIRSKSRKEYRRQRKRLAELGNLTVEVFQNGDDADAWIEAYLNLEAAGWKGEAGTAINCDPIEKKFFCDLARFAADENRLMMIRLCFDGKPISIQLNIRAGEGVFAIKTTYDESMSRFSPGVLLELEFLKWLMDQAGAAWADSCAVEGHPIVDNIWRERLSLVSLRVPAKGPVPRVLHHLELAAAESLKAFKGFLASRPSKER